MYGWEVLLTLIRNTVGIVTGGEKVTSLGVVRVFMEHPRERIHKWVYGYGGWAEVWFGNAIYHLLTCKYLKSWSDSFPGILPGKAYH